MLFTVQSFTIKETNGVTLSLRGIPNSSTAYKYKSKMQGCGAWKAEGRRVVFQLQKRGSTLTFPLPSGSVRTVCSLGAVTRPSLTVSSVACGLFIHWSESCLAYSSFSFIIPHLYISLKAGLLISCGSVGNDWCSNLQSLPVLVLLLNINQWAPGAWWCLPTLHCCGRLLICFPAPCIWDPK